MTDGRRTYLPWRLKPGRRISLDCAVTAPGSPGRYVLELDLIHTEGGWFGQAGNQTLRLETTVGSRPPDELGQLDYEREYAATDLGKDYWSIVGPASEDEFKELGLSKLKLLQDVGLRPGSRLLDIGCGTGSLTAALAGFLGSDGLYFGTDISEVAVRFCREKYTRPNFLFAQNEMTRLPVVDRTFDFIVFFSVFTHTYPAEIRELLAEAVRLLDDGGTILADAFESDVEVLRTRAMVVLARHRITGFASELGLEARTLFDMDWDGQRPARINRVMRRLCLPAPAAGDEPDRDPR